MLNSIGKTSIARLRRLPKRGSAEVWVKLEGSNPTGSYKDRMALAMVEGAERNGDLQGGVSLLECTGGSTGSSLAFVCAAKGYPFTVISSDAYAREKLDSMRAFGAEVLIEPSLGGRVTPDLWPRMRARAERLVESGGYRFLDQFSNPHASRGYEQMGREILRQVEARIDVVCGAVGTAGMIIGVGSVVREAWPDSRIVGLEPETSAVLSGREPGSHGIDGTAAGFVPPLLKRDRDGERRVVTDVMALPEPEARAMCRRLAKEEGIFAGTSTGLNVLAALRWAEEVGTGGTVVTVACDTGYKYLDGPLYR